MFITFEGIEGCGKTTQILRTADYLKGLGKDCLLTREPGGTVFGQKVRRILLDPRQKAMAPKAELLLYCADRVQHIQQVIAPALAKGQIVLCDRYFDATMAYQGYGRDLDMDLISTLHRLFCQNLFPDATLLLDLDPEIGLKRAWNAVEEGGRTVSETRFEAQELAFHQKVRQGYLDLAARFKDRFWMVDAACDMDAVFDQIRAILANFLEKKANLHKTGPSSVP